MKLPRRKINPRDILRILGLVSIVLILTAGLIGLNLLVLRKMARGAEFLTLWTGARAYLFEHASPYSTYVPEHVQSMVYERRVGLGENPFILDIPFNILLLFFPLAVIENPSSALVVFQIVLELTVIWFVFANIQHAHWNPKIDLKIPFLLFIALNYFTIHSILEGSLSVLVLAGIVGLLLSLGAGKEELAGALVGLLFFKWQVTFPILVFVLLRVIRYRMWRVVAGFAMLMFVLTTIGFFLYPGWTIPYLRALVNDMRFGYGYSTFTCLAGLFVVKDAKVAWIFTLLVIIIVIFEWVRAKQANDLQLAWTSCLTLAATPLLGFRLEIQELVLLLLPAALIFAVVSERWVRAGRWIAIILMVAFFLTSWLGFDAYFNLRRLNFDQALFLAFPILIIMGLYWIRWWALRPPRTWLDHITRTGA